MNLLTCFQKKPLFRRENNKNLPMKPQLPIKNYIIILALFVAMTPLNAQNIWGVDASVDVANAEFQNDFIQMIIRRFCCSYLPDIKIQDWTGYQV